MRIPPLSPFLLSIAATILCKSDEQSACVMEQEEAGEITSSAVDEEKTAE